MPRTTDAAVKQIISTDLNTMPFIMAASLFVTTYLAGSGLPEAHLAEIERWWAAHLVSIREPRTTRKRLGDTEVAYQTGVLGTGLQSTFYGQTALQLDSSGTLLTMAAAAETPPKPASFDVD